MSNYGLLPLNALRTFEAVARLGSFTKAADELGVTQAAVSHQIKALEGFVRGRLLERSRTGIRLSEAGAELYRAAQPALGMLAYATTRAITICGGDR